MLPALEERWRLAGWVKDQDGPLSGKDGRLSG
jgi:hypothetical protein